MGDGRGRGFTQDKLTEKIIRCIIKVHKTLGPGFKESVYRNALLIELRRNHLYYDTEQDVVVYYEGREVGRHRPDITVEKQVIIEIKTVEHLGKAHYAQLRSYLSATRLCTGILVNFSSEKADFRRIEGR